MLFEYVVFSKPNNYCPNNNFSFIDLYAVCRIIEKFGF